MKLKNSPLAAFKRVLPLLLVAMSLSLAACQSGGDDEDEDDAPATAEAAPAALVAPTNGDDAAWKDYLGKVVAQNMDGVTDRVFPYYLPADSTQPTPGDSENKSMYDRQLDNVAGAIARGVLPGNMLVFGSPDSAKMGDLVAAAFAGAKPDAMKGSQVLFIGKAADGDRVRPVVEASGAKFIFVDVE